MICIKLKTVSRAFQWPCTFQWCWLSRTATAVSVIRKMGGSPICISLIRPWLSLLFFSNWYSISRRFALCSGGPTEADNKLTDSSSSVFHYKKVCAKDIESIIDASLKSLTYLHSFVLSGQQRCPKRLRTISSIRSSVCPSTLLEEIRGFIQLSLIFFFFIGKFIGEYRFV